MTDQPTTCTARLVGMRELDGDRTTVPLLLATHVAVQIQTEADGPWVTRTDAPDVLRAIAYCDAHDLPLAPR